MDLQPFREGSVKGVLSPRYREAVQSWLRGGPHETLRQRLGRELLRIPPGLFVKLFHADSGLVGRLLPVQRFRARREFKNTLAATDRHVPVPPAVGFLIDSRRAILLTEEIKDAQPLREILMESFGDYSARWRLLQRLGVLLKRAMDAGMEHGDLHSGNVIVRGDDMWIVDLQSVRMRAGPLSRARRLRMLALTAPTLQGSVIYRRGSTTFQDVLRFLKAAGIDDAADWNAILRMTDDMRLRRSLSRVEHSLRGSSEYRREIRGEWTVVSRLETSKETIDRLVEGGGVALPISEAHQRWSAAVLLRYTGVVGRDCLAVAWRDREARLLEASLDGAVPLARFKGPEFVEALALWIRNVHLQGITGFREILVEGRWKFIIGHPAGASMSAQVNDAARLQDLKMLFGEWGGVLSRDEAERFARLYVGWSRRFAKTFAAVLKIALSRV